MGAIRVLFADDSVVYRSQIRAALDGIRGVEIVGSASNGRLALEKATVTHPDLLILDLEMPEKDGLETLRDLRSRGLKGLVMIFSSASKRCAELAVEALRLGASDILVKPSANGEPLPPAEKIRAVLEPKIHALFTEKEAASLPAKPDPKPSVVYAPVIWDLFKPQILVIGSSTGGPSALVQLFENHQGLRPRIPVLIAQHMPPLFTAALAERMAKASGMPVGEAIDGEPLLNKVYLAPGDYHLRVAGTSAKPVVALDQSEKVNSVRPAVDILFASAARIYESRCMGIVLTGMGSDGRSGCEAIKRAGGGVAIQDQESCVVYGMPGAVAASGAFDRILTPQELRETLVDKIFSYGDSPNV